MYFVSILGLSGLVNVIKPEYMTLETYNDLGVD